MQRKVHVDVAFAHLHSVLPPANLTPPHPTDVDAFRSSTKQLLVNRRQEQDCAQSIPPSNWHPTQAYSFPHQHCVPYCTSIHTGIYALCNAYLHRTYTLETDGDRLLDGGHSPHQAKTALRRRRRRRRRNIFPYALREFMFLLIHKRIQVLSVSWYIHALTPLIHNARAATAPADSHPVTRNFRHN